MSDYKIARSADGEWIALVKGNKVVYQGHSMTPEMVLDYLNIPYEYLGEYDLSEEGWFTEDTADWDRIT